MEVGDATEFAVEKERDKFNVYASSKSVSQQFLNTGIITFYINVLYTILKRASYTNEDIAIIVLTC